MGQGVAGRAGPTAQADRREDGGDRGVAQPARARVVAVDRRREHRSQPTPRRRPPGRDQNVVADGVVQPPVRADPGVEDPGGLQRRLDSGPVLVGHAVDEVDDLPQRGAVPAVPPVLVAGVRGRRRVVATGRQPLDLLGEPFEFPPGGRLLAVEDGLPAAETGGGQPRRLVHRGGDRVGPVERVHPAGQGRQRGVRVGRPQVSAAGQVGRAGRDEARPALGGQVLGRRDPLGGGLLLGSDPVQVVPGRAQQPVEAVHGGALLPDQGLGGSPGVAVRRFPAVQLGEHRGVPAGDQGGLGRQPGGPDRGVEARRVGLDRAFRPREPALPVAGGLGRGPAVPVPLGGEPGEPPGILLGAPQRRRVAHLRAVPQRVPPGGQCGLRLLHLGERLLRGRQGLDRRLMRGVGLGEIPPVLLVAAVRLSRRGGVPFRGHPGVPAVVGQERLRRRFRLGEGAQRLPFLVQAPERLGHGDHERGVQRRQRLGECPGEQLLVGLLGQLRLA